MALAGLMKSFKVNRDQMYDLFVELTNQLFWDGYAEQLATEDPQRFNFELNDFFNNY